MTGFCGHFGIKIGRCEQQLMTLAGPTEGWPRHLHVAQQALAQVALTPGIDGDLDKVTFWDRISANSEKRRNDYYRSRRSAEMGKSLHLVAAVMKELGERSGPGDVISSIETNAGNEPKWRLPKGMDSDQFYGHLVHLGALEVGSDEFVRCPIPSFRKFLIEPISLAKEQPWQPEPDRGKVGLETAKLHSKYDNGQLVAISNHAETMVRLCGQTALKAWAIGRSTNSEDQLRKDCHKIEPATMQLEVWGVKAVSARTDAERIAAEEIFRRARLADAVMGELRRGSTAEKDHAVLASRRRVSVAAMKDFMAHHLLADETREAREQVLTAVGLKWHHLAAVVSQIKSL